MAKSAGMHTLASAWEYADVASSNVVDKGNSRTGFRTQQDPVYFLQAKNYFVASANALIDQHKLTAACWKKAGLATVRLASMSPLSYFFGTKGPDNCKNAVNCFVKAAEQSAVVEDPNTVETDKSKAWALAKVLNVAGDAFLNAEEASDRNNGERYEREAKQAMDKVAALERGHPCTIM